jgi:hypothetical protein
LAEISVLRSARVFEFQSFDLLWVEGEAAAGHKKDGCTTIASNTSTPSEVIIGQKYRTSQNDSWDDSEA